MPLAYSLVSMVLDMTQMVLAINMIVLDNLTFKNCLKKSIPGDIQAQVLEEPVEAPMVIRMVLAVWKHFQITNFIILDNFCLNNCLKKSIPGDIRAQVLQEPVGASHGDQVQKFRPPPIWGSSWGQAGSNRTPYATCCLAIRNFPGG